MMKEARYNGTLEILFTKGRHERISIMSLEQDPFYSSHIERRNADYFVLTRKRDTSCMSEIYKKFCRDIQQWRFIDIYDYSVEKPLGFLIIDFVSQAFKDRINSLNLYYNSQTNEVDHIDTNDDVWEEQNAERELVNMELFQKFNQTRSNFNKNTMTKHKQENVQQRKNVHRQADAITLTSNAINQNNSELKKSPKSEMYDDNLQIQNVISLNDKPTIQICKIRNVNLKSEGCECLVCKMIFQRF